MKRVHAFARRVWSGESAVSLRVARTVATPAALAYGLAVAARNALYDNCLAGVTRVSVPTISVGSLVVGGAGKTPVAAWLAGELLRQGRAVALLHGGYADDEPALHRRWHPQLRVYARKERALSAQQAIAEGANVLLLDDGFQHRRLHRDLDIVLIPAETWRDAKRLLPRGPYREPPSALRRAHVVLVTRKSATLEEAGRTLAELRAIVGARVDLAVAAIRPRGWRAGAQPVEPPAEAVVVAGIAQPAPFEANVIEQGVRILDTLWYPDHYAYEARDAERILRAAGRLPIVTTAKDAIKLERWIDTEQLRVLEQGVALERGGDAFLRRLSECLREND